MFSQASMQIANLGYEDRVFPRCVRLSEAQRLEHLSDSRGVALLHQEVDIGHRPLSGLIQIHEVQRRALQANDGDPFNPAARVDLIEQFLNPAMTGEHVRPLAGQEISPVRGSLPAQHARQQGRYTVNCRHRAGQAPFDCGPVRCEGSGPGKLARQRFRDSAQSLAQTILRGLLEKASLVSAGFAAAGWPSEDEICVAKGDC